MSETQHRRTDPFQSRPVFASGSEVAVATELDHRRCAEECVARAKRAEGDHDKVLWLTLAQSWVRLAEHVAQSETEPGALPIDNDAA